MWQSDRIATFVPGAAAVLAAIIWWVSYVPAQPPPRPEEGPRAERGQPPPGGPGGRPEPGRGLFGGPGGPPGFGGGPGMGSNPIDLLRRQDVRKELELLDDQIKQIEALEQKTRSRIDELFRRPRERTAEGERPQRPTDGGPRPQRAGEGGPAPRDDMRKVMEDLNTQTRNELSQILLPHQMKRLNQLVVQMRMRGGAMAVLSGETATELGIIDQQREQLRTKIDEIEREVRRKEAEIRRQAKEQVILLLTPAQQAKYRELIGEPFEFAMELPPQGPPGGPVGGGPRGPERKN